MTNDLVNELSQNFINYAMAVNTDRSIPDAKSGLKPVARRILYAAYVGGYTSNKNYVKNATIVGDVIGRYHPHGDVAAYGALVRLAQPWVLRYPLIDFHGNKGNIAGDPPAHQRYTEGRLAKIVEEGMLQGIKKNNVPFMPTFDDSREEPVTLPAIFPNLLCNPNTGIGVAMASNWAPHNLNEVAQAIYDYIDGKEPMIPGPDFPTGGEVINKDDIPAIMATGRGSVKVRGRYNIEKNKIIFYEIPYGVQIESLLEEIGKLNESGELNEIEEVQDQSNKKGLRIVFECIKNVDPYFVVNKLFQKTSLQSAFSYNQVALVDGVPMELSLKDCCKIYVEHNIECLIKESQFDLKGAADRKHIIDGLLIALEDIDNVLTLIKTSNDSSDAKNKLMIKYKLDEVQAKSILAMRFSSLAHMEKLELEQENQELVKKINELNALLASYDLQTAEVRRRLESLVKKYGDARRTILTQIAAKSKDEKEIENIEPEKCVVIMSKDGMIKRIPSSSFKTQNRNGKGVKTSGDITTAIIKTNTIDVLMVFTNKGKMYRILVNDIPVGTNSSTGQAVKSLVSMDNGELPTLIYSIHRDSTAEYVLFVTKNGLVKKTALNEYTGTKKKTGISAINIKDNDELVSVSLVKDEDVILLTQGGMGIRFNLNDVSATGRTTSGMKGINLKKDDYVVAALPVRNITDKLAIITDNGLGKKINLDELMAQQRGGKGLIVYKPTSSSGNINCGTLVTDGDMVLISGLVNSICIKADDIPLLNRAALGNQLIKGTRVTSISKV